MAPISYLIYEATCPRCGESHVLKVQTCITDWGHGEWGARELRKGDRVPLADLRTRGFFEVNAWPGRGVLRILDDGMRCDGQTLFTEIWLDDQTMTDLRLVACDLGALDRLHFLPPLGQSIWDWRLSLPDPTDWNEDLYTEDVVRSLRTQLMLREPLPARNPHEADLFIELIGCTRVGPFVEVEGTTRWRAPCDRVELTFTFEDETAQDRVVALDGGPSRILPADVFRRKADELAHRIPVDPSGVIDDPILLAKVRTDLAQAIAYLAELRSYIPTGEEQVPLSAFWGDAPRVEREERAERYSRTWIGAALERWEAQLERWDES